MRSSIRKVLYFPFTRIILGIGVCFSLFIIVQNIVSKPLFYKIFADKAIADPFIHCTSVIVLLVSYYSFYRLYGKREITELSLRHLPKEMFGGFATGFFSISLTVLILYFLEYYQFIGFSTEHYSFQLFGLLMVAALIEDLFFRGIIVRECENWLGTNAAVLIGMLFESDHLFNPNTNLFSVITFLVWGFTMSMLFIYTKRIWLPYFFHLGWNFAQPFYGSNLTGLSDMGSIIQSNWNGPELLTGGAMGVESSILSVAILLLIGISLYVLANKNGKIIKRKKVIPVV